MRLKGVFASPSLQKKALLIYLKVDPDTAATNDEFARDVRQVGHWGTGSLELTLRKDARSAEGRSADHEKLRG